MLRLTPLVVSRALARRAAWLRRCCAAASALARAPSDAVTISASMPRSVTTVSAGAYQRRARNLRANGTSRTPLLLTGPLRSARQPASPGATKCFAICPSTPPYALHRMPVLCCPKRSCYVYISHFSTICKQYGRTKRERNGHNFRFGGGRWDTIGVPAFFIIRG